jgi:hypothetical protein
MKRLLTLLLITSCNIAFGQTAEKLLKDVNAYYEAEALMTKNPNLHGDVSTITSLSDTASWQKKLYVMKQGDIITVGKRTYKILTSTTAVFSRVSYIYLDGKQLSLSQIDSLRKSIISDYKRGVSFAELANKYTMDGTADGDLKWFVGTNMMPEFTDAINKHKVADVFTVDIPENSWYYVVKKTFESKKGIQLIVFSIDSSPQLK